MTRVERNGKTNLEMMFAVNKMFHKMYTQNIW